MLHWQPPRSAAVVVTAVTLAACTFAWDELDPRLGGDGPNGGSVGGGGVGGVGGQTVVGPGGAGGTGGTGGTGAGGQAPGGIGGIGGTTPALVDRGLIARYFINEAASGTSPTTLADAASDPLPLALDYGATAGGGGSGGAASNNNATFSEDSGHRGLAFAVKNGGGGAFVSIANTKLTALHGVGRATIECVATIQDGGASNTCSRISHLGVNEYGTFTLCTHSNGTKLSLRFNDEEPGAGGMEPAVREAWDVDLTSAGRTVLHAVLDTTLSEADRLRLYVDGAGQGDGSTFGRPAQLNEGIDLSAGNCGATLDGCKYIVGNRNDDDSTIEGTIYYCALYGAALDANEIANNVAILQASDDG